MRKTFTVILVGTLILNLWGCQKQPEEISNSYVEEAESEVIEKIKESDFNSEELNSEEYIKLKYESNNVCFEYSNAWELKELQHEDGKEISFWNLAGKKVIWVEVGEAWRVNLEKTEEDYKELLSESYDEVEIIELSKTNIYGYETNILTFSYNCDGIRETIKRYTVIAGYAFCEINISFALSEEEINSFVDSIEFISKTEEDYYMMFTSLKAEEVEQFAEEIKSDILENNWEALAEKISYPIVISGITVTNRDEFLKLDMDGKLNQEFVEAIRAETCRKMFCNWQGVMMGETGQIWFSNVDNGTGTSELLIIGINDMLEI